MTGNIRRSVAIVTGEDPAAIGPVAVDHYGDITGPFRLWKITGGAGGNERHQVA
ncbi:hypothetical protein [Paracoccus sp. SM22M-07]|uniref:hypothetical protein n=1 Tax=Paracoccus sp. SM22M-07 TaxID=1520813 RepID=UPI000A467251|nr:hypothetical protein [Paracoccus sp. SM22M-07]